MSDAADGSKMLVVVGPTASGKTELALRLAERMNAEIVSADSVQVYRHFDVGTGKPNREERLRAPHHLIDIVEPDEPMDAARWAELADGVIAEIERRGKAPIVCGGTFLWVRALLFGLAQAPPADAAVRRRHREWAEREGRAALHAALARVDPVGAARLHPNDFVRVSRALEVFELTHTPLSAWQERHAFRTVRHAARLVGVRHSPTDLDERMVRRIRAMFDAGWIAEVKSLLDRGWAETRPMRSVGYKQIAGALGRGSIDEPELLDEIHRATRVFGRRQRTWLRDQDVTWLDSEQALRSDVRNLVEKLDP